MNPSATLSYPASSVSWRSPLRWLALGWADLKRNPVPGLLHGFVLTGFASLLLWLAGDQFWFLAGAFSGFLIVAPIVATGLYHVSRACNSGCCVGMAEVVGLWRSGDGRLVRFGLLLGLAGTGWVMASAAMITLWSPAPINKPLDFLRHVVLARELGLFEAWVMFGALLAAPIFASSVITIPMLVDTRASLAEAVVESWRTVASHPVPMGLWALMITALTLLGMLTALLGLIVLIPLLAHSSWHAYCDVTRRPAGLPPEWRPANDH